MTLKTFAANRGSAFALPEVGAPWNNSIEGRFALTSLAEHVDNATFVDLIAQALEESDTLQVVGSDAGRLDGPGLLRVRVAKELGYVDGAAAILRIADDMAALADQGFDDEDFEACFARISRHQVTGGAAATQPFSRSRVDARAIWRGVKRILLLCQLWVRATTSLVGRAISRVITQ